VSPKRRESGGLYTWLSPITSGVASTAAGPSGFGIMTTMRMHEQGAKAVSTRLDK
jgi:hypothetical protein